jgi:hypothetical protein
MNILHDINICLIELVYLGCLVFVGRPEHDGPWLGKVSLLAHSGATCGPGASI